MSGFRPFPRAWLTVAFVAACLAHPAMPGLAHDGPEHEIEEITELIDRRGDTADLRIARAVEYLLLGRFSDAVRDLERAVQLEPASLHARRELARVRFQQGDDGKALEILNAALRLGAGSPLDQAGLHMLRAEVHRSRRDHRRALADCDQAIRRHRSNPEWYLVRSDLQRRLKSHRARVSGLEEGIRHTGAGVLEIERIEALLDAGRYRPALKAIEPELASARLKGRWLIRRGRARLGLGDTEGGKADLRAGIEELDERLDPARPDGGLLWDRAQAAVLLGDPATARRCCELARERLQDPDLVERLEALVAEPPSSGLSGDRDRR